MYSKSLMIHIEYKVIVTGRVFTISSFTAVSPKSGKWKRIYKYRMRIKYTGVYNLPKTQLTFAFLTKGRQDLESESISLFF